MIGRARFFVERLGLTGQIHHIPVFIPHAICHTHESLVICIDAGCSAIYWFTLELCFLMSYRFPLFPVYIKFKFEAILTNDYFAFHFFCILFSFWKRDFYYKSPWLAFNFGTVKAYFEVLKFMEIEESFRFATFD